MNHLLSVRHISLCLPTGIGATFNLSTIPPYSHPRNGLSLNQPASLLHFFLPHFERHHIRPRLSSVLFLPCRSASAISHPLPSHTRPKTSVHSHLLRAPPLPPMSASTTPNLFSFPPSLPPFLCCYFLVFGAGRYVATTTAWSRSYGSSVSCSKGLNFSS